jgi:hypothetical protein
MKSIARYGETIVKLSEFVKSLDESVRTEAFKFLLAQELGQVSVETSPAVSAIRREAQPRAVAPQELIRKSNVSSFTEKAVVLAYWLEKYQQHPMFSSVDLKSAFDQAREKPPQNMSDLVAKVEATARIMKGEKVGKVQHYRLTSTAMKEVEGWLDSEKDSK